MSSRRVGTSINWMEIKGTYGEFCAPGSKSPVSYLLTHASLGSSGTGNTQLTKHLVPIRELFDVGDLNFDELLQRDLDDHRVASEIIPYLLKSGPSARFFPPILAVILPVKGKKALDCYPERKISEDSDNGDIVITNSYAGVFEFERYKNSHDEFYLDACVRLNPDQAKIAVLDGQHRAMAVLAIRRAKSGEWGDRGSDYKHFYEDIAYDLKNKNILDELDKIELPVCLAFLPESCENGSGKDINLVKSFRKLFLDVNKEARKPSRARQLLLDDTNLISVLARDLLSRVRDVSQQIGASDYSIDLDCFEYDSPHESPQPRRDLALCTIEMMYEVVRLLLFSDDEYYNNPIKFPSAGRQSQNIRRFLSEVNADAKITGIEIEEWGFADLENDLKLDDVPSKCHNTMSELFWKSWGSQIIYILSELHPMKAHIRAVSDLRNEYRGETGHGRLAWRALFDGQGLYWTIKNYTEHRNSESISRGTKLPQTNVENAYYAIRDNWIPKYFQPNRAKYYWQLTTQKPEKSEISSANNSYDVYRTMAFQIGFLMAVAFLKQALGITDQKEFDYAVKRWVESWNQAFKMHPKSSKGDKSLSMFDSNANGLMGRHFRRLQKSDWVWFRYFSFEMLQAVSYFTEFPGKDIVTFNVDKLRKHYIKTYGKKIQNDEKRKGNEISLDEAIIQAKNIWKDALNESFGMRKMDFEKWWKENKLTSKEFTPDLVDDENGALEYQNGETDSEDDEYSGPQL